MFNLIIRAFNYSREKIELHPKLSKYLIITILIMFSIVFGGTIILGMMNFTSGGRDSAVYQSALWQAGNLYNPIFNIPDQINGFTFLSLHFMPIGYLYGLIYAVFPSIYTTAIIYTFIYCGTFLFTYLSTKNITNQSLIAILFSSTLITCYTLPIQDFYPLDDWAIFFIAGGIFFFTQKSYRRCSIFWVIAAMHKEYYSLSIATFGAIIFISKIIKNKNKPSFNYNDIKWPLNWIIYGSMWFFISFFFIMKIFGSEWVNQTMFEEIGTPINVLYNPLETIGYFFEKLSTPNAYNFILKLLVPLIFLSVLGFEFSLSIVPIIIILIIADGDHATKSHVSHYTNWLMPFIINGAALGFVRLKRLINKLVIKDVLIFFIISFILFNNFKGLKFHFYYLKAKIVENYALRQYQSDVKFALSKIPQYSSVATDEYLLPYFSNRRSIIHLSNVTIMKPEYIVRDITQRGETRLNQDIFSKIYDSPIEDILNQPSDVFYSTKKWSDLDIDCDLCDINYNLIHRSGSIGIFKIIN